METNFKLSEQVLRLSESIKLQDIPDVQSQIHSLIEKRVQVQIQIKDRHFFCDSHSYYQPGETQFFSRSQLYWAVCCNYQHKFCLECIKLYIRENFSYFYLQNYYPCIYCQFYHVENTLLLNDSDLEQIACEMFGQEFIYQIVNYNPYQIKMIPDQVNLCATCQINNAILTTICINGHQICQNCINYWIQNMNPGGLKCLIPNCSGKIHLTMIVNSLSSSPILFNLKSQLESFGIQLKFCGSCKLKINPEINKAETICKCGQKVCNNCGRQGHYGLTCFYFESNQQFEVIDLMPPAQVDKPQNLREQEYLNAKYAFENFVGRQGLRVKAVRLIVNKPLENRYSAKKKKMAGECGGEDKVNEVYIWHGSRQANYDTIMRDGLKVGGVDAGVPVAQGAAYGYGIYSATTPDTPMGYASDSQWLLACLAMKGNVSATRGAIGQLDNGKTHSHAPGPAFWHIFFTKEQVLPRFLIQYG
jgi:hypothetical protein